MVYNNWGFAGVAELADAHVWGACGFTVRVQFPSPAPTKRARPSVEPFLLLWERLNPLALCTKAKNLNSVLQAHFVRTKDRARIGCTYRPQRYIASAEIVSLDLIKHTSYIGVKSRAANSRTFCSLPYSVVYLISPLGCISSLPSVYSLRLDDIQNFVLMIYRKLRMIYKAAPWF